ncbi:allergen Tha p 1-like [Bacillus rossius redtenbacheri]|uniref:allergen Tha p 1-like n=1 Tax=Bacillus rossius redtenbacheri TaxID=93214 RepID=UPI002FDCA136
MTPLLLLAAACGCALLASAQPAGEKYSTKYDDVDLKEILANKRLLDSYANCILDKGPCTADGSLLREAIPDALTNGCAKCSDKQKEGAKTVIKDVRDKHPALWQEMKTKYDPSGLYESKYQKELEGL